jgi:hypothetical protein
MCVRFNQVCSSKALIIGAPLVTDTSQLRQRYLPLRRVGICIPGGTAAYPSTLIMTAVPAQVAGVEEIAVVAPPTQFGSYNTDLLAACHELGIKEVYRVGGAQGVAAMAYGVEGIKRVDKIVGPDNLFVALAKRHVTVKSTLIVLLHRVRLWSWRMSRLGLISLPAIWSPKPNIAQDQEC